MMQLRPLLSAFVFAATLAHAQTSASRTPAVLLAAPAGQDCPVSLSVRRNPAGPVSFAADTRGQARPALSLSFEPRDTPGLVQIRATAHGVTGGARAVPAAYAAAPLTETFRLVPPAGQAALRRGTFALEKLSHVAWIELNEIRFTDGTTWHPSAASRCIAEPNGLLLVSSR